MSSQEIQDPPAGRPTVVIVGLGSHPVLGGLFDQLAGRGRRRVVFLPLENYPQDVLFTIHQVEGDFEGRIAVSGDDPVEFEDLTSVVLDGFFMVSAAEGLSPEDLEYRNTESWAALKALFKGLSDRCLVINQIDEREHFDSRLSELSLLHSYGLPVPRVLVSSSPEEVAEFYRSVGEVLYRPVSGTDLPFSKLEEKDLQRLEELRLAPVHFEEAPAGRLAGCVKVGRKLFMNPRDVELPEEIQSNFLRLCEDKGLHLAELRLCQKTLESPWTVLGMSSFFTEQAMEDPEAVEAAILAMETGGFDA